MTLHRTVQYTPLALVIGSVETVIDALCNTTVFLRAPAADSIVRRHGGLSCQVPVHRERSWGGAVTGRSNTKLTVTRCKLPALVIHAKQGQATPNINGGGAVRQFTDHYGAEKLLANPVSVPATIYSHRRYR